jgi:hypothetical protein
VLPRAQLSTDFRFSIVRTCGARIAAVFGADQLFALRSSARTQIDHYACRGPPLTAVVQWADPFHVVEFR